MEEGSRKGKGIEGEVEKYRVNEGDGGGWSKFRKWINDVEEMGGGGGDEKI